MRLGVHVAVLVRAEGILTPPQVRNPARSGIIPEVPNFFAPSTGIIRTDLGRFLEE
jgi:hypothetical protein